MKIKVNWPALLRFAWAAFRQIIGGIVGGGIVSFANGCSIYGSGVGFTA